MIRRQEDSNRSRRAIAGALLMGWFALASGSASISASGSAAAPGEGADLEREVAELRQLFERRIDALEERIRELEVALAAADEEVSAGDEREALRAAAIAAAGAPAAGTLSSPSDDQVVAPVSGRERDLNRFNPEISFTGIFVGVGGDVREDFNAQEFELDLQSALDPFSRTRLTLAFDPEEGVDIEEGYVLYSGLPTGLELKLGKFRQRFGKLNQQHLHALPQVEYPLALTTYFGDEGLAQTGVAGSWILPRPWATANELSFEVTDGETEVFGGESFARLVVAARLTNFWQLSPATYLEWGLSGASGRPEPSRRSSVFGTDLTVDWQPPSRAKYRRATWRTEILRSEREDAFGRTIDAWGGYTYLEGLLTRNLEAGLRYDRVEDPLEPELRTTGWFPYLSWWQSEFVRWRAQYGRVEDPAGDTEDQFTLQLTWAAGPHKHETY